MTLFPEGDRRDELGGFPNEQRPTKQFRTRSNQIWLNLQSYDTRRSEAGGFDALPQVEPVFSR